MREQDTPGSPERPRRSLVERAAERLSQRDDPSIAPETTAASAFYQPAGPVAMPPAEPSRSPPRHAPGAPSQSGPSQSGPSYTAPIPAAPQPGPAPAAPERTYEPPATRRPPLEPASAVRPTITLDLDALAAAGLLTPRGERNHMSEEYRAIKRPLIQYAQAHRDKPNERANLIMITSAVPGEGKTFTSVNLAMSIAKERDINVVLIDADLSRPAVAPRLGVPETTGLTDLLENPDLSVPDVLLRTNVPNLSLILAGRSHSLGTELLASQRAMSLIDEIGRRYPNRIIIFDTSPVLASNEVGALSTQVGQIIMVVEAEKTTELEVKGALDVLSGCENVSLLLNKTRTRFGSGRFSNYYYSEYFKK